MEPSSGRSNQAIKTFLIVLALLLVAGAIGWKLGRSDKSESNQAANNTAQPSPEKPAESSNRGDVKSLVSYTLPDGWSESSCPSSSGAVYIAPTGTSVDCNPNPSSPVKIYIDPESAKDCNQLQNVQNVKKHICSSLFINNRKTLKALTEYNQQSSYKKDTTISSYHLDAGREVVKVEYIYNSSNDYEAGFDQLAKSLKVKS